MTPSLLFWILMLLWLLSGAWNRWGPSTFYPYVFDILTFLLFLCLGWAEFGPPLHR